MSIGEITPLIHARENRNGLEDNAVLTGVASSTFTNTGVGTQFVNAGAGYQVNYSGTGQAVFNFNLTVNLVIDGLHLDHSKINDIDRQIILQQVQQLVAKGTNDVKEADIVAIILRACCGYRSKGKSQRVVGSSKSFYKLGQKSEGKKSAGSKPKIDAEEVAASVVAEVGVLQPETVLERHPSSSSYDLPLRRRRKPSRSRWYDFLDIHALFGDDDTDFEEGEEECLYGDEGEHLEEDMGTVAKDPKSFYTCGRVFRIYQYQHESQGFRHRLEGRSTAQSVKTASTRLVVVWNRDGYCWCVHLDELPEDDVPLADPDLSSIVYDQHVEAECRVESRFVPSVIIIQMQFGLGISTSFIDYKRAVMVPWTAVTEEIGQVREESINIFQATARAGLLGDRDALRALRQPRS